MKPWHVALVLWSVGSVAAILIAGEASPGATAAHWLVDPERAAKAAGSTAERLNGMGAGAWAAITLAALTALGFAKKYAPLVSMVVPGWGKLIEGIANGLWHVASTRDQKAAEHATAVAKDAAGYLVEVARAVRGLPPGTLPDHVQQMVASPIVTAAIDHLSNPKA